ncbi:hypothetical protein [Segetibacter sp. 3557_3]|uniref:hypothetical protein n=1 Tax=Segetibacter sp. 3557_3 TaxID=2547429 RepID=UPI001FB739EA|nr:hypothetical protein [Segetibacter sp. 3557_3]
MRKDFKIDSINELLEECILAYPVSSFIISLYKQYRERGSLSKKQLQGLYAKALKVKEIPPGKLAAVEAIIKKMPTRDKSALPTPKPLYQKDESAGKLISDILERFPEHKRVLFLRAKFSNNEPLSSTDLNDLQRIAQLLKK